MGTIDPKYHAVRYTRGHGLHMACGERKAFPHMLGVDLPIEGLTEDIRPDITCDPRDPAALAATFNPDSVKYVYAPDALDGLDDELDRYRLIRAWWDLIEPDGHLVLGLPGRARDLGQCALNDHPWQVVDDVVYDAASDRALVTLRKSAAGQSCKPQASQTVCIVRHGGFGDQLQAAGLFPQLKREGFHITVLTTPKGRSVLEHDPHVDDWFMVDEDQVPNHELGPFWRAIATRFDRFVNLNESVEGVFLAMPGRIQHTWPHAVRHEMLNRNYAEFAAKLAQIPFVPEGQFYPTDEEKAWADDLIDVWTHELNAAQKPNREQRRARGVPNADLALLGRPYILLYALAGSSVHKFTPWQDAIVASVLQRLPRAIVVMVGDNACKILEAGLTASPRLKLMSGELSIRQTLTLAQKADCVLGPETGVLNAVAYDAAIKKIVLLSHSSAENLTKHWRNVTAVPGKAACYPCHQLHLTGEFCPRGPSGAAACQEGVDPAAIWQPLADDYMAWGRGRLLVADARSA